MREHPSMVLSTSSFGDRPKSHFSLPSPPADFDQLELSPDAHCWQLHPDPCRSVHDAHVLQPPGGPLSSSIAKLHRISPYRCQSCDVHCIYPSPPSTGSQAKQHVPLPEESHRLSSMYTVVVAGGILDSPPVLRHITSNDIPLSPPPTIPTTTQSLPEPESRQTSPRNVRDQPPLPSPESDNGDLPTASGELAAGDPCCEAVLDESDPGGALEPLLSPLSPEWSTKISNLGTSDESDSLSEPASLTFSGDHRDLLSSEARAADAATDDIPEMLDFSLAHPMDEVDSDWHPNERLQNEWSSWINGHDPIDSSERSDNSHPPSTNGYAVVVSRPQPHPPPSWFSHWPVPHSGQLVPLTLDIPPHAHHTLIPPISHCVSKPFGYSYRPDDTCSMDIDHDEYRPGASSSTSFGDHFLPMSPSLRTLPTLPDFSDDDDDNLLPASPSPSRRSFSTLPALEDDDEDVLRHPSSPNQTLLSLPGSDTDDDLIPAFTSAPSLPSSNDSYGISPHLLPHTSISPSHGLMLMDDQIEDYGHRSPSPELFDIDLDIDEDIYPEFEQLCELRKKALSAEREARSLETLILEQSYSAGTSASNSGGGGTSFGRHRAEVRRQRKREKERAKEIGALLRLKLGNDKVAILQEEERRLPPRKMASSLPRLVAQMVFRRNQDDVNGGAGGKPRAATKQGAGAPGSSLESSPFLRRGYVPSSLSTEL